MRANRLVHALTVSKPGSKFWDAVYIHIPKLEYGRPFNLLLSYYYLQQITSSLEEQVEVVKVHRDKLAGGGKVLIDSGIYSLKTKLGFSAIAAEPSQASQLATQEIAHKSLPKFTKYLDEYAAFLKASSGLWDIAFDFDAEQFLGAETTDILHERLLKKSGLSESGIARVYHMSRLNASQWWKQLCTSGLYKDLAIEGGVSHGRNPDFYLPLIDLAHKNEIAVHIFAIGGKVFLEQIPCDTVDSTSHLVGGKFGTILTPIGNVSLSVGDRRQETNHYNKLSKADREWLKNLWKTKYNITVDQLWESPYHRNMVNIWHMNEHWDVEYTEKEQAISLFDILET